MGEVDGVRSGVGGRGGEEEGVVVVIAGWWGGDGAVGEAETGGEVEVTVAVDGGVG